MARKKKTRVQFRKNRGHAPAAPDLTHQVQTQGFESTELPTTERVSGKGELTRYRTIVGVDVDASGQLRRAVNELTTVAGRVVANRGTSFIVQAADRQRYDCSVRRVVRTLAREERNVVVTGDHVVLTPGPNGTGVIERVESRTGTLSRQTRRGEHLLVANVDQVLIVVAAAEPQFKPNLIDRYLISAALGGVRPIICVNKIDLVDPVRMQPYVGLYSQMGYEIVLASVTQQQGIVRLRRLLRDRETVVAGQSGVGKSSLLNAIQPGLKLATGAVTEETRKGRHTTTNATLLELEFGGWVVDTPGVRQFELCDIERDEVAGFFREFRPFLAGCKFPGCTHTHESGCRVKQAVDQDLIAITRYESYLKLCSGDDSET